jgi:hypothetical protein
MFLKIILSVIFLVISLPLSAFCNDTHLDKVEGHGHCVTMCSFVCSHATVSEQRIISMFDDAKVIVLLTIIDSSYQNPSLDSLLRPPMYTA